MQTKWKPALIIEVMIPKKLEYYGKVQKILESLFDEAKMHRILLKAEVFTGHHAKTRTRALTTRLLRLFGGYSIYEVDGRFIDVEDRKKFDERVLVVRIVFQDRDSPDEIKTATIKEVTDAVEKLIGDRLLEELKEEVEIWITWHEAKLKVWSRR